MAMAMAMAMAMMKQQRSKLNWEGMLKRCCLSAHSNGTHSPLVLPKWRGNVYDHPAGTNRSEPYLRWDSMLKGWKVVLEHPSNLAGTNNYETHRRWDRILRQICSDEGAPVARPPPPPQLREGDVVSGVYEIAQYFKFLDPAQIEEWLDVLQVSVESIDLAQELHSIGCLVPLLNMLRYYHDGVREKTVELVTTMVHNNPRNQQLVLELGVLYLLFRLLIVDPDETTRIKAMGAISALIRNNKPGITTFQHSDGYTDLCCVLCKETESVVVLRDALNLVQYLLHENSLESLDYNKITELELPTVMMYMATIDDAQVREAALRGLLELVRLEGGNSVQLVKNDDILKQVLQERIEGISAMAPEDLGAARQEIQLVDSLWNACYNEPSSLGEKGLLHVLPGEYATAADRNSVSVKKRKPSFFKRLY